jgi:hypothetical protein
MDETTPAGYAALLAILEDTNLFSEVSFGTPAEPLTAQDYPLCWVRPKGFDADDTTDPVQILTTEQFEIEVRVLMGEGEGGLETFGRLHQLVEQIRQVLNQQQLGIAIPGLTLLRSGKYHETYPTSAAILSGSFARLDPIPE